jgi:nucleobase:cation symporter-1, NCS1 family
VVGFAGASTQMLLSISQKLIIQPAGRTVPLAATRIYEMSFFTGFGVSATVYYLSNVIFPVVGKQTDFREVDVSESTEDVDSASYEDDKDADKQTEKSLRDLSIA